MFNPLVDSLADLSDAEIEEKLRSLTRKYFQTQNPGLQMQIAAVLDMYKEEFKARQAKRNSNIDPNSDLDSLINIS